MYRCLTYRSAGAEELVYRVPIDILFRWSKAVCVLCVDFIALGQRVFMKYFTHYKTLYNFF